MSSERLCPVSKLENLLLATDRSAYSSGAEREAINFARKCATKLYIMSVLESNPEYETIGSDFFRKEEEEAVKFLASLKEKASQEGVDCETLLRESDDPVREIVDEADRKKADMIVIGKHGRTGLLKILMGKVAANVIGHAPCKVLVVPKAARIKFQKILIATDGSGHSVSAASEAIGIAKSTGSHILALSAAPTASEMKEATDNVNRIADMARKEGVEVEESLTAVGKPSDMIVETAGGRGVDLIVMGTYGKTGFTKLLMGSSTEKVVGLTNCAVLVVKA